MVSFDPRLIRTACGLYRTDGLLPSFFLQPNSYQGIRARLTPTISLELSRTLSAFFSKEKINAVAKETDFIKRERTISGFSFAETLLYSDFDHSKLSLGELAESFTTSTGKLITRQAIEQRFTPETVAFFKRLIELALQELKLTDGCYVFLKHFNQVRIKDSTSFQLPPEMAEKYPGSGGGGSGASVRIQFEYDLKSGSITDLSIGPYNTNDHTDATATLDNIEKGNLIIRDLGYISTPMLQGIKERKAYFLNRLRARDNVYEKRDDKFEELDFIAIRKQMKKNKLKSIERDVYITKEKEPVRMIIELMPEEEVKNRLRKAKKEAKKKGRKLTARYKARASLNLFITNIAYDVLDKTELHSVYTLRWQVELIFKIWKSIGGIHKIKKMKLERFESYLYAKLLWIISNWLIIWNINQYVYSSSDKLLSFYKAFRSLKKNKDKLQSALSQGVAAIREFVDNQTFLSVNFHLLDKRKNGNSMYELINIM